MEELDLIQAEILATTWYLYRQAGYPYGKTMSGFDLWRKTTIVEPFNQLAEKEEQPESTQALDEDEPQ